jgi:hypothetical protein
VKREEKNRERGREIKKIASEIRKSRNSIATLALTLILSRDYTQLSIIT